VSSFDHPREIPSLVAAVHSAVGVGDDARPRRASAIACARVLAHVVVLLSLLTARRSDADGTLLSDDTWDVTSCGCLAIDGGLVVGFPAALPTGMSTGVGGGITYGHDLAAGGRIAWSTATESTGAWQVTHSDLKLRVTGAVQHTAGRGTFGLRLGAGGTVVHESRVRSQGMRAGLTGADLETSAFAFVPAIDLDAVVTLHVSGPWALVVSGGPTIESLSGSLHGGWSAALGVAWHP
jgi:hypothetical protein